MMNHDSFKSQHSTWTTIIRDLLQPMSTSNIKTITTHPTLKPWQPMDTSNMKTITTNVYIQDWNRDNQWPHSNIITITTVYKNKKNKNKNLLQPMYTENPPHNPVKETKLLICRAVWETVLSRLFGAVGSISTSWLFTFSSKNK